MTNEYEAPITPPSPENDQPTDSIDLFSDGERIELANIPPGSILEINEQFAFHKPAQPEHYLNGEKEPDWFLVTPHENGTVTETRVEMHGTISENGTLIEDKGVLTKGRDFSYAKIDAFKVGTEATTPIASSMGSTEDLDTEEVIDKLNKGILFIGNDGLPLWRWPENAMIRNVTSATHRPTGIPQNN